MTDSQQAGPAGEGARWPTPIFHPIDGRADCRGCHGHASVRLGAPAMPESHATLTSVTCQLCHARLGGSMAALGAWSVPAVVLFMVGLWGWLVRLSSRRAPAASETPTHATGR